MNDRTDPMSKMISLFTFQCRANLQVYTNLRGDLLYTGCPNKHGNWVKILISSLLIIFCLFNMVKPNKKAVIHRCFVGFLCFDFILCSS